MDFNTDKSGSRSYSLSQWERVKKAKILTARSVSAPGVGLDQRKWRAPSRRRR